MASSDGFRTAAFPAWVRPARGVEQPRTQDTVELPAGDVGGRPELRTLHQIAAEEQNAIDLVLTTHADTFELLAKR